MGTASLGGSACDTRSWHTALTARSRGLSVAIGNERQFGRPITDHRPIRWYRPEFGLAILVEPLRERGTADRRDNSAGRAEHRHRWWHAPHGWFQCCAPDALHANVLEEKNAYDPTRPLRDSARSRRETWHCCNKPSIQATRTASSPTPSSCGGDQLCSPVLATRLDLTMEFFKAAAGITLQLPIQGAVAPCRPRRRGCFMPVPFGALTLPLPQDKGTHHWRHERQAPCELATGAPERTGGLTGFEPNPLRPAAPAGTPQSSSRL